MAKSQLVPAEDGKGKLAAIMPTEARLALPEVVNVFINKYETKLLNEKSELSDTIRKTQTALHTAHTAAVKSGDFKSWEGLKQTKLGIVSILVGGPHIDWDTNEISHSVGLCQLKDGKPNKYKTYAFERTVSVKLDKKHIKVVTDLEGILDIAKGKLTTVVGKLGDMSRKERQVKARISEMRLEEQGLTEFLEDGTMQALLEVDQ